MPYMLDDRHVEDSLFIVLEEDFKLFAGSVEPIASEPKLTKGQRFPEQDLPTRGGAWHRNRRHCRPIGKYDKMSQAITRK